MKRLHWTPHGIGVLAGLHGVLQHSEMGFALPSVLMLLTVFCLMAASLLTLQSMQRQLVLRDQSNLKAEYAAQSGVARLLAILKDSTTMRAAWRGTAVNYSYEDGSESSVETREWGMYLFIRAEGRYHNAKSLKLALVGVRPSWHYDNALVLGNVTHQLVLAGSSSIVGDVIVGLPGLTTGSLSGYTTPIVVPHTGRVVKRQAPALPRVEAHLLQDFSDAMADLFRMASQADAQGLNSRTMTISGTEPLGYGEIPDSIEFAFVRGPATVTGSIVRYKRPLTVVFSGPLSVRPGARIQGCVLLACTDSVTVSKDAAVRHAILYSESKIHVQSFGTLSGQLIAPTIEIGPGASLTYPSAVVSLPAANIPDRVREVNLYSGARIEGVIGLFAAEISTNPNNVIRINQSATVVGTLFADARTTLDGRVIGSVISQDFYFYVAPTSYIGWLRTGQIDRKGLPEGFLLPPPISGGQNAAVLEWL